MARGKKASKPRNVKIGDILFFKTYLTNDEKGIISGKYQVGHHYSLGDGIASNKLECC
jgi:hypothetical protein